MAIHTSQSTENIPPVPGGRRLITGRAVVLSIITGVLLNTYTNYTGMVLVNSALVKSQLPMATLLPFVGWLFINLVLRIFLPRIALSGSELVLIYSMSWIVGTIPVAGWATYWGGIVSSPMYFASPENPCLAFGATSFAPVCIQSG